MRILHIATAADWAEAKREGSYTTSALGRTLAEEGFIHASRGDQWQAVRDRYYRDVAEPLLLLVIDTDRLGSPVVDEQPPGTPEPYPHVYGPINTDAVVQTIPLDPYGQAMSQSFSRLFLTEVMVNALLGLLVMVVVATSALVGQRLDADWGPVAGTLAGLAVGVPLAVWLHRRRG